MSARIVARSRPPIEEEVAAPRVQPSAAFPRYRGPGLAEIKPHTVAGIRGGLRQLARAPRAGRDAFLITYRYTVQPAPQGPVLFTTYVLRPHAHVLTASVSSPQSGPVAEQLWLDGLGSWHVLGTNIPGPNHSLARWRTLVGPTVFGSLAEPFLRDMFIARFGPPRQHLTATKLPHAAGSDVAWREVAAYLYELADEIAQETDVTGTHGRSA